MPQTPSYPTLSDAIEARQPELVRQWLDSIFRADSATQRAAGGVAIPRSPALQELASQVLASLASGETKELETWLDGSKLAMYADRVILTATHSLTLRCLQDVPDDLRGSELQERIADVMRAMFDAMLQRSRAAMASEASEFQEMAAVLKDTLYSTLSGGMVRYVSPSIEPLTGHTMADFLDDQQLWTRLVEPDDLKTYRSLYSRAIESAEPMEAVYRLRHARTHQTRHVLDRVTPVIGPDGSVIRLDGILIDITDRIEFEARLERAEQLRILGQLARDVAHDFNNLLVSILGHTDILLSRLDEESREASGLRLISRAAEKGATLTGRLLAFARGSVNTGDRTTVRLDEIARDAIDLARPSSPRHIELRLETPDSISMIRANPTSLGEALLNLLLNAIHACAEGSGTRVTLKLSPGDVDDCHLVGADDTMVLEVIDDGHGMTDEVRMRVFEPLFTTRTDKGGTGLGCAVAYGVAVEHGGLLEVNSVEGRGTTFTLVLPALPLPSVEAIQLEPVSGLKHIGREGPAVVDQSEEAVEQERVGPRILAVEDEHSVSQLMKDLLEGAGYRVMLSADGRRAIDVLKAEPTGFDLVILDVMMDPIDDTSVLALMREIQSELPVLYCTSHEDTSQLDAPQSLEGVHMLHKPFRAAELFQMVRTALKQPGSDS